LYGILRKTIAKPPTFTVLFAAFLD